MTFHLGRWYGTKFMKREREELPFMGMKWGLYAYLNFKSEMNLHWESLAFFLRHSSILIFHFDEAFKCYSNILNHEIKLCWESKFHSSTQYFLDGMPPLKIIQWNYALSMSLALADWYDGPRLEEDMRPRWTVETCHCRWATTDMHHVLHPLRCIHWWHLKFKRYGNILKFLSVR